MSFTSVTWIVVALIGGIALLFWLLQYSSDKTYRPAAGEVATTLRALSAGQLSWAELDEFSCVRIAYDQRLDQLRERCNDILDDASSFASAEQNKGKAVQLSNVGQARVKELIDELETWTT
jgi:hypothetical protein